MHVFRKSYKVYGKEDNTLSKNGISKSGGGGTRKREILLLRKIKVMKRAIQESGHLETNSTLAGGSGKRGENIRLIYRDNNWGIGNWNKSHFGQTVKIKAAGACSKRNGVRCMTQTGHELHRLQK